MKLSSGQTVFGIQNDDDSSLQILQQKSFIGGVPTDNIIEALDEEEDIIARKLQEINEANDPEKDILNVDTDEETIPPNEQDFEESEDEEDDDFFDDPMDNGIHD
jgi:hypothetical protein